RGGVGAPATTAASTWCCSTSSRRSTATSTSPPSPAATGPTACWSCRCHRPPAAWPAWPSPACPSCWSTATGPACPPWSPTTSRAAGSPPPPPRGRPPPPPLVDAGHEPSPFTGDEPGNPLGFTSSAAREQGYRETMADAGLTVRPGDVRHGPHARPVARDLAERLLAGD